MIAFKTFSDIKWVAFNPASLMRRWERVRERARAFIADEIREEDVISISESAFGNSPYAFTVTVWYRKA
jgi:hypothetical protein